MASENFKPLDLNEENVDLIFNLCHAPDGNAEDEEKYIADSPFSEELGYDEDSPMVFFYKDKALENKENILYLLGQLKGIENKKSLTPGDFETKYTGEKWTDNKDSVMKLIYLTDIACLDIISIFINLDFSNSAAVISPIKATLSPLDENFRAQER